MQYKTILKRYKIPIIIIICLIFNIIIILNYAVNFKNKKTEFKEIKPLINYSKKLEMPTVKNIKIKNINPSVISDKTIYLTFDDGPSYLTEKILDILKEENIPATFFVTSRGIDTYSNVIKRMQEENHTIALHTSTHNYSYIYSSDENYFKDLEEIRNKVYNITGVKSRIIRLPGGSSNTVSKKYSKGIITRITNRLTENDFYYFDWNIDSLDASGSVSKEVIYNSVTQNIHSGTNVVLMHDSSTKETTVLALKDIIKYAKDNGYTFAKITKKTPQIHHPINNWNKNKLVFSIMWNYEKRK